MDVTELMDKVKDTVAIKRVFGEPIEQGGVTIVPVAFVAGGGGGGTGTDADNNLGSGGGFGFVGYPIGVFEISNGTARFRPTFDAGIIMLTVLHLLSKMLGRRRRKKRR